jgi:hypothetical protein
MGRRVAAGFVTVALALLLGGCSWTEQFCGRSVDDPREALLYGLVCLGYDGPPNGPALHASVYLETHMASTGTPVQFSADKSVTPDHRDDPIVKYEWDFGDGKFVRGPVSLAHVYAPGEAGLKTIRLRVTDQLGYTDEASTQLDVMAQGPSNPGMPPTASFTARPNPAALEQSVSFDASASTASGRRSIVSYRWDFGDGSPGQDSGSAPTVEHTYYSCGTMHVTLRATDSVGNVGEATGDVSVSGAGCSPSARIHARPVQGRHTAGAQLFAAEFTRARLVRAGTLTRRGSVATLRGVVVSGRLRGHVDGSRRLTRLARARWAASLTIVSNRDTGVSTLHALVLATFRGRGTGTACLRVDATRRGTALPRGSFAIVGGSGAAAHMAGGGRFLFGRGSDGLAHLAGRVRATRGRAHALPPACSPRSAGSAR